MIWTRGGFKLKNGFRVGKGLDWGGFKVKNGFRVRHDLD